MRRGERAEMLVALSRSADLLSLHCKVSGAPSDGAPHERLLAELGSLTFREDYRCRRQLPPLRCLAVKMLKSPSRLGACPS